MLFRSGTECTTCAGPGQDCDGAPECNTQPTYFTIDTKPHQDIGIQNQDYNNMDLNITLNDSLYVDLNVDVIKGLTNTNECSYNGLIIPTTGLGVSPIGGYTSDTNVTPTLKCTGTGIYTFNFNGDDTNYQATATFYLNVQAQQVNTVNPVTFSPSQTIYYDNVTPVNVTLSTTTNGANIYYTLDGSNPTQSSNLYSSPISLNITTAIHARGYKNNYNPSTVSFKNYIFRVGDLIASPDGPNGPFSNPIDVTLLTPDTTNTTIYYTLDGSDPAIINNPSRLLYSSPIHLSSSSSTGYITELWATAEKTGLSPNSSYDEYYEFTGYCDDISLIPRYNNANNYQNDFSIISDNCNYNNTSAVEFNNPHFSDGAYLSYSTPKEFCYLHHGDYVTNIHENSNNVYAYSDFSYPPAHANISDYVWLNESSTKKITNITCNFNNYQYTMGNCEDKNVEVYTTFYNHSTKTLTSQNCNKHDVDGYYGSTPNPDNLREYWYPIIDGKYISFCSVGSGSCTDVGYMLDANTTCNDFCSEYSPTASCYKYRGGLFGDDTNVLYYSYYASNWYSETITANSDVMKFRKIVCDFSN